MIRMNQFRSSREAKDYYTAALKAGDYYTAAEQDCQWRGELAKRLGLDESVTQETFTALADNLHPETGKSLTPRTNSDRTTANDINFHVPKGISVLHLVSQDDRIIDAIREAMRDTMSDVEKQARTRVRVGGKQDEERTTGELVWGEFVHTTTRPDKDGIPDIHLHAHCFVFNATWDPEEQRIKAVQFRDMKRDMPYHQAAFYNRLAWRLEELGYRTERTAKGWDVAGISDTIKAKFSRRTAEINALADKLGIKSAIRKAGLGAKTRARKDSRLSPGQLRKEWMSRLTPGEVDSIEKLVGQRSPAKGMERTEREHAAAALEMAIEHKFISESVVPEPRLLASALGFGVGRFRPAVLREVANEHPELLRRREGTLRNVTTRSVLREEEAMLEIAREGRGICKPLEGKTPWEPGYANLNRHQSRAIKQLMESRDAIQLVRGGPGTGKTTMLRELAKGLKGRGETITPLGSTIVSSRGTLRDAGFRDADTLASFLGSPERQRAARGTVLWVDEAGIVGTKSMLQLFAVAEAIGARVILCGDTKQHPPSERGDALRLLETRAGLIPAELTEIVRQQGTYKDAVAALHKGDVEKAMGYLDRLGAIVEIKNGDWTPLIFEYMDKVRSGRSAVLVAPTHKHGDELSSLIRASLKREGKLASDERLIPQLKSLNWSPTERSDAARYEKDQVVVFHRRVRSGRTVFAAGERVEVAGRDDKGNILVKDRKGAEKALPLKRSKNFEVHGNGFVPLAVGESIRATGNGRSLDGHRINNGALFTIAGFTRKGNIRLENGWEVDREFGKLAHAYVTTSVSSQSRTGKADFLAQGASGLAGNREQVLVSISRGRDDLRIYCESRDLFIQALSRSSTRQSAVELMDGSHGPSRSHEHAVTLAKLRRYEQDRDTSRTQSRTREQAYERR